MFMEDSVESNTPSMGLDGLGWGGFLNPVHAIQHAAAVVQAHTPAPLRRLSPIGIVQRQLADVKRIKASQLRMARHKRDTMMAIAARSPLGRRIAPSGPDTGDRTVTGPTQAEVDAAQAAADAKAQADYDAQQAALDAQSQPDYSYNDMPLPGGDGSGRATPYSFDSSSLDQPDSWASASDTSPTDSSSLDTSGEFQYDPLNDTSGDNIMQLSNIPSSRMFPSNTFKQSGMGDIWGDLMTTGLALQTQRTQASIAQSQAAQADAAARTAAAQAAAINASKSSGLSAPVMLGVAAALGGVLFIMKRRGKR